MEKSLELKYIKAEHIEDLPAADRELIAEAQKATELAYAKYSPGWLQFPQRLPQPTQQNICSWGELESVQVRVHQLPEFCRSWMRNSNKW